MEKEALKNLEDMVDIESLPKFDPEIEYADDPKRLFKYMINRWNMSREEQYWVEAKQMERYGEIYWYVEIFKEPIYKAIEYFRKLRSKSLRIGDIIVFYFGLGLGMLVVAALVMLFK